MSTYQLYDHNRIAYDKLNIGSKTYKKLCIVQPTGTGKSFITAEFLKENPKKKFLIISANNHIKNQFNNAFNLYYSNYDFIIYPNLISKDFKKHLTNAYDYIILDEFHRAGAELWGRKLNMLIKHYSKAIVIGMTATHIRYLENDRDMTNELFDGNLVHNLTIMECFDKGILPRPKYITAIYNIDSQYDKLLSSLKSLKGKNIAAIRKRLIEFKANWEYSYGADIILKKHITKERNFLVFCRNIEHLESMILTVTNWFKSFNKKLNIYKVYSTLQDAEDQLTQYVENTVSISDEFNLLFSVEQLNEGLHINNTHGVIFLRPTESNIIYQQQLGRGLKTKGFRPLVFDMVNNFKKSIVHSSINEVEYEEQIHKHHLSFDYDKYKFGFSVIDETQDVQQIFKESEFAISPFMYRYNKVLLQLQKDIPLSGTNKTWLAVRRDFFKANRLLVKEIILLDELNPLLGYDWKLKRNVTQTFDTRYSTIKASLEHKLKLTKSQLVWLQNKRNKYLKGELSLKHIKQLDSLNYLLNYDWKIPRKTTKTATERITIIKDVLVSGSKLSQSQQTFIRTKRKHIEKLSPDTIKKLDNLIPLLGFDWKKRTHVKKTDQTHILSITKTLNLGNSLSSLQNAYLHRKRNNLHSLSAELIEQIDTIIPLLGRDWKVAKIIRDSNTNILEINERLKANKALLTHQKLFLTNKRKQFISGTIDTSLVPKLNALESLLGYKWTEYQVIPSRKDSILAALKKKEALTLSQTKYINRQTTLFNRNELSKQGIDKMTLIGPYLDYDWKTPKPIRLIQNNVEQISHILNNGENIPRSLQMWLAAQRRDFNQQLLSDDVLQILERLKLSANYDWLNKKYI